MAKHRKTIKHFEDFSDIHEITFSCHERRPLLVNDSWNKLLAEHIKRATVRHHYKLLAFVFMPEHVHLLVAPGVDSSSISMFLSGIKRPFSYRIKQILLETGDPLFEKLTVQQRPGVSRFRFWLEGPGYDRNVTDQQTFELMINYIHENPVKRGLCERAIDWKWSSARRYLLPELPEDADLPELDLFL
ncbi:MAG: transposase [Planctomycetaceae bacterium]